MLVVVKASEFDAGAAGYRLAELPSKDNLEEFYVPGWFEDCFPEMSEVQPTVEACLTLAKGLGYAVYELSDFYLERIG